jgi:hypothetical protein
MPALTSGSAPYQSHVISKFALTVLLIVALPPWHGALSQWQAMDLPGADIRGFAVTGDTIYAVGVPASLHRSTNDGASWTLVNLEDMPLHLAASSVANHKGSQLIGMEKGRIRYSRFYTEFQASPDSAVDDIQVVVFYRVGDTAKWFAGGFGAGVRTSSRWAYSWSYTNSGLSNLNVTSLAVRGAADGQVDSLLYAGTYGGGIFLSKDAGETWGDINQGLGNLNVYSLLVHGDTLLAAHLDGMVSRSIDAGSTWAALGSGLPRTDIVGLAVSDPGGEGWVFATTLDAGVWRCPITGGTWSACNAGLGNLQVNTIASRGSTLLAGTHNGIFRSTDRGESWQAANDGASTPIGGAFFFSFSTPPSVKRLLVASHGVYMASSKSEKSAVMWSDDLGKNWNSTTVGSRYKTYWQLLGGMIGDSIILVAPGDADYNYPELYLSKDRSRTWNVLVEHPGYSLFGGIASVRAWVMHRNPGSGGLEMYVSAWGGGSGLYQSLDTAKTWTRFGDRAAHALAAQGSCVYMDYPDYSGECFLLRSSNSGQRWDTLQFRGRKGGSILQLVFADEERLFCNVPSNAQMDEDGGLYASPDCGVTWIAAGFRGQKVSEIVRIPGYYFAVSGGRVFASFSGDPVWKDIADNLPSCGTIHLTASTEQLVALSTDGLSLWSRPVSEIHALLTALPAQPLLSSPVTGSSIDTTRALLSWLAVPYSSSYRIQLSETPEIGTGLLLDSSLVQDTLLRTAVLLKSHTYYWRICALNPNGYGPWSATYHFTVSPTATSVEESSVPKETALMQNWPNPFNPTTSIGYTVGAGSGQQSVVSEVQLAVYDLLGREVAVLVDERKEPGNYSVKFDGSCLSSGTYIYRLTVGDRVFCQKMVLVR